MILFLRIIFVLLRAMFRSSIGAFDRSSMSLRVYPNDLDLYLHMNNGRYLSMMDLGRLDYIVRCGILRQAVKRRWYPVVGSATIRFIRSLGPFEKFRLETELICWDEKWVYLRQRFWVKGELMAAGIVKGIFRSRGKNIAPAAVLATIGRTEPSPPVPDDVIAWQRAEASLVSG